MNVLRRANENLPNHQPFSFYLCRAELVVEWHDRNGCPWGDPMSIGSHDWEEISRSTSIISWHGSNGKRILEKLETSLEYFDAVLNPNSNINRFWDKPETRVDAWGDPDESDHEVATTS